MALVQCPECQAKVSSSAPACPQCGYPFEQSPKSFAKSRTASRPSGGSAAGKVIKLLFGAFCCWLIWSYLSSSYQGYVAQSNSHSLDHQSDSANMAPVQAASADMQRPVDVLSPQEIYRRYQDNEVAADQSWAGHDIQITAPIEAVDKDFTDSIVLKFDTGEEFSPLQATLEKGQESLAASFSRGQTVTVICKKLRRIMESPMADSCEVQR